MHAFCFVVFCFNAVMCNLLISFRLALLALEQSYDCPSASEKNMTNILVIASYEST